jgi:hypothetical protein
MPWEIVLLVAAAAVSGTALRVGVGFVAEKTGHSRRAAEEAVGTTGAEPADAARRPRGIGTVHTRMLDAYAKAGSGAAGAVLWMIAVYGVQTSLPRPAETSAGQRRRRRSSAFWASLLAAFSSAQRLRL